MEYITHIIAIIVGYALGLTISLLVNSRKRR